MQKITIMNTFKHINEHLINLFATINQPLNEREAARLSLRIYHKGGVIVLFDGKMYANTIEARAKYFGRGYIVTVNGVYNIPLTCYEPSKAARNRMRAKFGAVLRAVHTTTDLQPGAPAKLETRAQMFNAGKGERTRKKPLRAGRWRINAPLRGMALNCRDMQRNKPGVVDYYKYLNI